MDGRVNGMSCYFPVAGSQVRDLEERLVEKEYELKQMRRNLDESEGAIAQVGGRHFLLRGKVCVLRNSLLGNTIPPRQE